MRAFRNSSFTAALPAPAARAETRARRGARPAVSRHCSSAASSSVFLRRLNGPLALGFTTRLVLVLVLGLALFPSTPVAQASPALLSLLAGASAPGAPTAPNRKIAHCIAAISEPQGRSSCLESSYRRAPGTRRIAAKRYETNRGGEPASPAGAHRELRGAHPNSAAAPRGGRYRDMGGGMAREPWSNCGRSVVVVAGL